MTDHEPIPTPGAKMMYLIRRRPTTSREELVAHWYANHMPLVIAAQKRQADAGKLHATRYIVRQGDCEDERRAAVGFDLGHVINRDRGGVIIDQRSGARFAAPASRKGHITETS